MKNFCVYEVYKNQLFHISRLQNDKLLSLIGPKLQLKYLMGSKWLGKGKKRLGVYKIRPPRVFHV